MLINCRELVGLAPSAEIVIAAFYEVFAGNNCYFVDIDLKNVQFNWMGKLGREKGVQLRGANIRLITPYTSNDMQIDPGLTVTSFELVEKMGRKSMSQWESEIKTTAGSADFVLLAK